VLPSLLLLVSPHLPAPTPLYTLSLHDALPILVPATSGSIRFGDAELTSMRTHYPPAVRNRIQAVFQDPYSSLNPSMTVEDIVTRSEEHTSELQSRENLVCRLLLEKKKNKKTNT